MPQRSPSLVVRYDSYGPKERASLIPSFPLGLSVVAPGPISIWPESWDSRPLPQIQASSRRILDFIQPEFLSKLEKNPIMALSVGCIDSADVFAVTPCGHLILNVTKETYEKLGLEGKRSRFSGKDTLVRYQISLNLKEAHFAPGNKHYDRVKWSFTNVIPQAIPFTVLDMNVLSDGASKAGRLSRKAYPNVLTPPLASMDLRELIAEKRYEMMELLEWIGMLECEADRLLDPAIVDPYLSVYAPPPDYTPATLSSFKLSGLLHPDCIQLYIDEVRKMVQSGQLPWVYVSILGNPDAPVSWGLKEHGYLQSGENDAILLFNTQGTLSVKVIGDADETTI